MVTAVLDDTRIQSDVTGKPVSWSSQWTASNFNGQITSIPMFGDVLRMAYTMGARTLLVEGIGVYYAGTLGVVVQPNLYSGATNTLYGHWPYQATARSPDILTWDMNGWPLSVSEALQKATIGSVQTLGYAATDDMTIWMWGRFL